MSDTSPALPPESENARESRPGRFVLYALIPLAVGVLYEIACLTALHVDLTSIAFWSDIEIAALRIGAFVVIVDNVLWNWGPTNSTAKLKGDPLQTQRLDNGKRLLLRSLTIHLDGQDICVPKNTVTDYSSIPWYGRFIVRWSKVDIAGVVHDWLYREGEMTRREADRIWYVCARSGDSYANPLQAWVAWAALRLGGRPAWNAARRAQKSPEE